MVSEQVKKDELVDALRSELRSIIESEQPDESYKDYIKELLMWCITQQ